MVKQTLFIALIFTAKLLSAQVLFHENFENINTQFDATAYYKDQLGSCNSFIRNNSAINCLGTQFANYLNQDVTSQTGNFLMHATARTGSSVGEAWGTSTPISVSQNSNFVFEFYLANVFNINLAQIQPFINGVAVGSVVSAVGEGNNSWKKFTFFWNSGTATSADLSLRNFREEAAGNDFAFDEIRFAISNSVLMCENFENVNTQFDATAYYKDQLGSCNSFIRNNSAINCLGTQLANYLTQDITLGNGNFLMHATARTGSSIGEVWGTVIPLTVLPNTNYNFEFYLANVFNINTAQIQPFINGNSLGSAVSSLGEGNNSWTKFSFIWNSRIATTADLSLRNQREEATGNDFALDNICFSLANPIPVELNTFEAIGYKDFIQLNWITETEMNMKLNAVQIAMDLAK